MSIYKFNSIFHQLDISLLRHFFAIATFGGFLKASKATGVSQPALSLGLQKLEKSLGVILVDRSKRPFELTPEGVMLLSFCQKFQGSFESVVESFGGNKITVQKRLRIGSALSIGIDPFVTLCKNINQGTEKYELELQTLNSYVLLNEVLEKKLDAAIVPDDIYDSRLKFVPLLRDSIIFIVGEKYKNFLNQKNWKKSLTQIPLITFPRDTPMRTLTDKICISENLEFSTVYSINQVEGLKALVKENGGGAFVMRSLVESELRLGFFLEIALPIHLPKAGTSFVMRIDESKNSHSEIILSLLRKNQALSI